MRPIRVGDVVEIFRTEDAAWHGTRLKVERVSASPDGILICRAVRLSEATRIQRYADLGDTLYFRPHAVRLTQSGFGSWYRRTV